MSWPWLPVTTLSARGSKVEGLRLRHPLWSERRVLVPSLGSPVDDTPEDSSVGPKKGMKDLSRPLESMEQLGSASHNYTLSLPPTLSLSFSPSRVLSLPPSPLPLFLIFIFVPL